MKWHEDLLERMLRDLQLDPPEFISIVAPCQNGKTTLAKQLENRIDDRHPELLCIYIGMRSLGPAPGDDVIARHIFAALLDGLQYTLEAGRIDRSVRDVVKDLLDRDKPKNLEDLTDFLRELLPTLSSHSAVVLLIDDIDALADDLQTYLLTYFRWIHGTRSSGPLHNLSIALLSSSPLMIKSLGSTSPYNVAREYSVSDFDKNDLEEFLDTCATVQDGLQFTPDAIDYLYSQTEGQMILAQKICDQAVRADQEDAEVRVKNVIDGIRRCIESRDPFFHSMLTINEADQETIDTLLRLVHQEPILPWGCLDGVARLMEAGIVKKGPHQRCVFRSPLLHGLFATKLAPMLPELRQLSGLNPAEDILIKLPQVLVLLLNRPLQTRVEDILAQEGSGLTAQPSTELWMRKANEETYQQDALEVLNKLDPPFDEYGAQVLAAYYFREHPRIKLDKTTVFEFVAKVYAKWSLANRSQHG
jgi:hypothetical protein